MFCSTIIPTIGRTTLTRAVTSVLEQTFPADDFEIIVVNDSGNPLPEEAWQSSDRVQVIHTNRRERSVARNTGAAIAKGKYLHFLDDDDWLLPGAFLSLLDLAQISQAVWLYGASQLVDRQGEYLIQLHHGLNGNCFVQVMAGEWIPLQASLVLADTFFAIGGFNPRLSGPEDIDLCRRVALTGDFASTSAVVVSISMGEEGSTTNYARSNIISRWAREDILSTSGTFPRMLASADANEWYGRITRIYLSSMVWNLQRKKLFTAASRAIYSLASLVMAGPRLLSRGFWRSITTRYESQTFIKGFQALNHPVLRRVMSK